MKSIYSSFTPFLVYFVMITCSLFSCDDEQSLKTELAGEISIQTSPPPSGQTAGQMMTTEIMQDGTPNRGGVNDAGQEQGSSGGEVAGEQGAGSTQTSDPTGLICEESRSTSLRLVALSFPFSEIVGEQGHTIQLFQLNADGSIDQWGDRIDLGYRCSALKFTEDGLWVLAISERGQLTAIDLRGESPSIGESIELPTGSYSAIQSTGELRRFDLINRNSDELAGIYEITLSCDGEISADIDYHQLRLIQGFQRVSDNPRQGVIFGGQALFDPLDFIDLRWLISDTGRWMQVAELDVYEDFIDSINVGLSPQGQWVALVNGSPFTNEGGQVRLIEVISSPISLQERAVFEGYTDVRGAWFLPDGDSMFITQFEPNIVQFFTFAEGVWAPAQRINGVGLPEQVAIIEPPPNAGDEGWWLLIPSTAPSGESGLAILNALDARTVMTLPMSVIGNGYENIPKAISAWPTAP